MRRINADEEAAELVDDGERQAAQLLDMAADTRLTRRSLQRVTADQRASTGGYLDDETEELE